MGKVKIVVDTNIFISAFLGSKKAKFLVKEILNNEYILIMSVIQLAEVKEVLLRPKFKKYISVGEINELIDLLTLKVNTPAIYDKITDCRDKKDNMILEVAVYGNAQYIITGDEDLLVLHPYKWIKIVKLTNFLYEMYDLE
ncbi:MAG: putative toxin-antitoxin system toxin component, PIN family [Clostridia bacterium]|jgi:putative PIN family toxin of toxin-antitoxin system|nr:putative toxin-antitoxin system toxin component, PIN family [Clostridia bacterium]